MGNKLISAIKAGDLEKVEQLLTSGAEKLEIREGEGDFFRPSMPLHVAAQKKKGGPELVRCLLKYIPVALVDSVDSEGSTALHQAAYKGNDDVIKTLLVEGGARVNVKNNEGSTALGVASLWGHAHCVKALGEGGADLEARQNDGSTALHLACQWGRVDCVEVLIESGAEVEVRNGAGKTPREMAVERRQQNVLQLMNYLVAVTKDKGGGEATKGGVNFGGASSEAKVGTTKTTPSASVTNHIFVSHFYIDREVVYPIVHRLEADGYAIWIDKEGADDDIPLIIENIEKSSVVLVFCSTLYQRCKPRKNELKYAQKKGKTIIPILVQRDYKPEDWLGYVIAGTPCYDFSDKRKFQDRYQELMKAIQAVPRAQPTSSGEEKSADKPKKKKVPTATLR